MVDIPGEPLVILLIEDNEDHAELVMRGMREQRVGNRICHVTDGQQALDFLFHAREFSCLESSPNPNLILLDLRLPKVDGLEVLRIIKETPHLQRIPVVILTSSEVESDIAKSYDFHANSYVVKPLDFSTFSHLMKDLGFYWLGWNTKPALD